MPLAQIFVLEGHPRSTTAALIKGVSEAFATALEAPKERLRVWLTEVPAHAWGYAGDTAENAMTAKDRADVEMPLVMMHILEGRPKEMHHRLIELTNQAVASALGTGSERIRVCIIEIKPDSFGIAGVPAAIARQAEIAARAAAKG
jgi:4-oxalocrotonate tautomerase family enzyme